jgi:hypothetical protein
MSRARRGSKTPALHRIASGLVQDTVSATLLDVSAFNASVLQNRSSNYDPSLDSAAARDSRVVRLRVSGLRYGDYRRGAGGCRAALLGRGIGFRVYRLRPPGGIVARRGAVIGPLRPRDFL